MMFAFCSASVWAKTFVPVFGTVAVGWAIGRTRLLTPEGLRGLTNVTFYALFPSLLFRSMSRVRIEALSFDILFVFFGAGLLLFFASIALARAFGMRLGEGTVFALSVIFSNGVGIGIPFISYAFGEAGLVPLLMIISLNSLVMLTLASFLIEISQQASSRESLLGKLGGAVLKMLKHPVIPPIFLGLFWGELCAHVPGLGTPVVIQTGCCGALGDGMDVGDLVAVAVGDRERLAVVVEQHLFVAQVDANRRGDAHKRFRVRPVVLASQRSDGHGAVHRAGVEINKAQFPGQPLG